jgi:phosphate transport system substrate-binding protein
MSCGKQQGSIKIKGSDTEVNLVIKLAEEFRRNNSEVYISITGGGSGLGIASLLNGQADIANSSRPINAYETALFVQEGIRLDTFCFAEDAIAFIVSSDLPLDTIWVQDLGKVLSGVYTNWSALTGQDLPINIYGRPSNSGTHEFVKKKLRIEFSEYARQMNGNAQIIEAIKTDHSGIGYVGSGYVRQEMSGRKAIKVLRIASTRNSASISPLDSTAIVENRYFFQRPLYQYIRGASVEKVTAFIDFEKSSKGAEIIKSSGYYPIPGKKTEHK